MNRSKFQFSNPELKKVTFSVNENFDTEKHNGIALQSNTEVEILSPNEASVDLTVNIGDSTDSQPFDICVKMGAKFAWDDALELERAKQLLNVNAPAVLLSYIRPIVSSMTNSSRYHVLNLPFIDFTKSDS